MYLDQVFCFTPKGDLIALPQGSVPIDFAYAVHSEIGDTCVGARINGRLLPLRLCPLHGAGLGDGGRSRGLGDEALHGRVAGEPSGTRRAGSRRGRHVGVVCVCWCAKAVACGLEALLLQGSCF